MGNDTGRPPSHCGLPAKPDYRGVSLRIDCEAGGFVFFYLPLDL